jgi:hypothetical protein
MGSTAGYVELSGPRKSFGIKQMGDTGMKRLLATKIKELDDGFAAIKEPVPEVVFVHKFTRAMLEVLDEHLSKEYEKQLKGEQCTGPGPTSAAMNSSYAQVLIIMSQVAVPDGDKNKKVFQNMVEDLIDECTLAAFPQLVAEEAIRQHIEEGDISIHVMGKPPKNIVDL